MCRFRLWYPATGPSWAQQMDDDKLDIWDDEWDAKERSLSKAIKEDPDSEVILSSSIQTGMAYDILMAVTLVEHCGDCHPLNFTSTEEGTSDDLCQCDDIYGHFINLFHCIPCVLREEDKLLTQRQRRTTGRCAKRNGSYYYTAVSDAIPFTTAPLTNGIYYPLRMRKTSTERARRADLRVLWNGEWILPRLQSIRDATHLCTA